MNEVEITWDRAIGIWWLIIWRTLFGSFVLSFIFGAVIGFFVTIIGTVLGWPHDALLSFNKFLGLLVGAVTTIFWGITVIRMAVRKQYSGFRLAVVANPSKQYSEGDIDSSLYSRGGR